MYDILIHEITLSAICIFLKCCSLKIPYMHMKGLFFVKNFQLTRTLDIRKYYTIWLCLFDGIRTLVETLDNSRATLYYEINN